VELTTTDQPAAKEFYGGLFGWEADDRPVGEGVVYSMMSLEGKSVAAIAPQPSRQREAGAPSMWNSYLSVQSADEAAERVKGLGGTVHAPAFDVMDVGRMAVLQDPHGAWFMAWEPKTHIGAGLVNAPGALVWNELHSPDPQASSAFYGGLFGWTTAPFEGHPEPYLSILNGNANAGGIRPLGTPEEPAGWLVYFGVEEIDGALAKTAELGGATLAAPIDIQVGEIAVVSDPQGAVFALFAGEFEP
jgi:uncharacterized protein